MRLKPGAILALLLLAGCAGAQKPALPQRMQAALEAESEGAKRYQRGDYSIAARGFAEAARIFASVDNAAGTDRNRLHLARAELAQGRPEAALQVLNLLASSESGVLLEQQLIKAQALLGLGRYDAARQSLADAAVLCAARCEQFASLNLLQARVALADKRAGEALAHAESALKLLQDQNQPAESGNAWRLIAAARLAEGDAAGALPAARKALETDRELALPEKIARDWLLIGDIQHRLGAADDAANAYRRGLEVATAAGLAVVVEQAAQAIAKVKQ